MVWGPTCLFCFCFAFVIRSFAVGKHRKRKKPQTNSHPVRKPALVHSQKPLSLESLPEAVPRGGVQLPAPVGQKFLVHVAGLDGINWCRRGRTKEAGDHGDHEMGQRVLREVWRLEQHVLGVVVACKLRGSQEHCPLGRWPNTSIKP